MKTKTNLKPSILYTKMSTGLDSSNLSSSWFSNIALRYKILAFVVLATCIDYITRVNINVAIVTMVYDNETHSDIFLESCPSRNPSFNLNSSSHIIDHHDKMIRSDSDKYTWSPKTQGVILGSFWYSYMLMQVPSGRLAEEFGGKWIVAISLIGSGLINLLTPFVTFSVTLLVVSRIILGFLQGGIFPSCFAMLHKWMPIGERSVAFAFMDVGATIGSVIATTSSGYLSEHGFAGGWPSVFYMSGIVSLLALSTWIPFVYSDPRDHPNITKDELDLITGAVNPNPDHNSSSASNPVSSSATSSRSRTFSNSLTLSEENHNDDKLLKQRPKVPWRHVLTSGPVLAIIVSKFSLGWSYLMLLSKLPAYLHDVLHIAPTENGLLNASLYLTSCFSLLFASHVSERIILSNTMSRTTARKTFQAIACFGTTICLGLVPSVGCDTSSVMIFLLFGGFFSGFNAGGDVPVAGEISHNFPATIYAMANMAGCSCGFIAPYVVGVILETPNVDLLSKWALVFYLSSFISFSGGIIFLTFGSAKVQPWDSFDGESHSMTTFKTSRNDDERILFTKDQQPPYKSFK